MDCRSRPQCGGTGAASVSEVPETGQLKESGMEASRDVSRGLVHFQPLRRRTGS